MPRQDVPYGGAICRLKERIAEIWDELGKKLHSINGVEGDAAGDVKIVSGDAAVVITNDQVNHEVEIALDSSQLPTAAVSSVNGQTGAVVLDANDIDAGLVPPGTTVAQDLASTKQQMQTIGGLVQQEILDRQNADSALQGNINTLSASIPTAAATAVANDPTVAQLATDVPNKVDKITSGSSLKAYTHTGATQGETAISSGTDANSIGLRDANGRMYGADPASGATDRSFTTANWVSQTGNTAPNNLIHKTGAENKSGILTFSNGPQLNTTLNNAWEGFIRLISNKNWNAAGDVPSNNQTIRLIQCSGPDGFFMRINSVLTTSGTVRLQVEWTDLVNGVRTYRSTYLT